MFNRIKLPIIALQALKGQSFITRSFVQKKDVVYKNFKCNFDN